MIKADTMLEVHFENMLACYPNLIEPGLKLVSRQETLRGKRVDLMFRDEQGATLVVEVKIGTVSRADVGQLGEYCHYFHQLTGVKARGMLVGTRVPDEVRGTAEYLGLECRAISLDELQQAMLEVGDRDMLALLKLPALTTVKHVAAESLISTRESKQRAREPNSESTIVTNKPTSVSLSTEMTKVSTIDEKYRSAFAGTAIDTIFNRHEIWVMIESAFPGQVTEGGMLPQDRCYNITNAGLHSSRSFRIFDYVGRAAFRYFGEHYPYNGAVTWKGVPCGEWNEGVLTKWNNWPTLKSEIKLNR